MNFYAPWFEWHNIKSLLSQEKKMNKNHFATTYFFLQLGLKSGSVGPFSWNLQEKICLLNLTSTAKYYKKKMVLQQDLRKSTELHWCKQTINESYVAWYVTEFFCSILWLVDCYRRYKPSIIWYDCKWCTI